MKAFSLFFKWNTKIAKISNASAIPITINIYWNASCLIELN